MGECRTQHNRCENGIPVTADMKHFLFSIWIYRFVRISLAVIFFWSGVSKLFIPESFAVIIEAYGLVPDSWIMPTAILISALEVILAIGLLFDIRGTLAGITGLLVLFMAILIYGIRIGLDVDCGCFGPEDPEAEAFHGLRPALYRDMGMAVCISYLYVWRNIRHKTPGNL